MAWPSCVRGACVMCVSFIRGVSWLVELKEKNSQSAEKPLGVDVKCTPSSSLQL